MTEEEREIDLLIAELEQEARLMRSKIDRLERVEKAAKVVVSSFTNSIDYDSWDKALDHLETTIKEKNT